MIAPASSLVIHISTSIKKSIYPYQSQFEDSLSRILYDGPHELARQTLHWTQGSNRIIHYGSTAQIDE